jgi:hypothetical protein
VCEFLWTLQLRFYKGRETGLGCGNSRPLLCTGKLFNLSCFLCCRGYLEVYVLIYFWQFLGLELSLICAKQSPYHLSTPPS